MTRDFRLLWLGEGVSLLGNATTAVLLPLLAVVGFGAGPVAVGVLGAAAWLPWLLVGLPVGAWIDVRPPRAVMLASNVVAAVLLLSVPVAAWAGVLTLPWLIAVAFGNGTVAIFVRATYPALVREVAPAGEQERAFARLFGTESVAEVAGPSLAGVLSQLGSAATGLLLDAASYVVSAVCLARMRTRPTPRVAAAAQPLRQRVREGIAYVCGDRLLVWFLVTGGVSNFGLTGYQTLLVLFLVRDAHLSPGAVGVVLAVGSLGGVLGALAATPVSERWGSARGMLVVSVLGGPPALLLLLAGPGAAVLWVPVATVTVGLSCVAGNVIKGAWRNRYVPRDMVGRQMTTAQVVTFGTMPVAALTAGWLGDLVGLRWTIAVMASIHLVGCLALLASPVRAMRDLPVPEEPPASARLAA